MAILRLVDTVLNGQGVIGEVKTGEGKSFIIAVAAICLARYGKKVDVVTSNLELARRDQEDQKKYYDLFKIKSGVLFNKISEKEFMAGSNFTVDANSTNELEAFNTDVFRRPIVYSTNGNFQFVYLHSLFRAEPLRDGRIRPYDVVIVDEVDNMFLDQKSNPAILSRDLPQAFARDVLEIVYLLQKLPAEEIMRTLQYFFPACGKFTLPEVKILKDSAMFANAKVRYKDYIVENGEVVIVDSNTGYKMPGQRWENGIHEMVELKERLKIQKPNISYCQITQHGFFNLYQHITGVTETIGSASDEAMLTREYGVEIFRVPRHFESRKHFNYLERGGTPGEIFGQILAEIHEIHGQNRPILVIMDSIKRVNDFIRYCDFPVQVIQGIDPQRDRQAVAHAGNFGVVTIATSAAGRGMDIKVPKEVEKLGGLHVILPFLMPTQRALEQAAGRSGRQGQRGSVSIYQRGNDFFIATPDFDVAHDNLTKLELQFSQLLRNKYGWAYGGGGKGGLGEMLFPYGTSVKDVLDISAYQIFKQSGDLEVYRELQK